MDKRPHPKPSNDIGVAREKSMHRLDDADDDDDDTGLKCIIPVTFYRSMSDPTQRERQIGEKEAI